MSIFQIVKVWEHEFTAPQQIVMLALADHAHDDGTSIKPGLDRVAWKTGYGERQVRRIVSSLRKSGVLVITRNHGDGRPTEYRLNWSAAKAKPPYEVGKPDILTPTPKKANRTFEVGKADISGIPNRTFETTKPDTETPLTVRTVNEPSMNRHIVVSKKTETANHLFDLYNAEKPLAWKTATALNEKRRKSLQTLISEHGEQTFEIFRAALVFARSDEWWAEKNMTLDTLLVKGRVLEFAEKSVSPQIMHGLSDADMRVAKTAHDIYDAIGGFNSD